MGLYDQINTEIKSAMKAKDKEKLNVMRMMKSKIMAVDARGDLADDAIIKILATYEKNLKDGLDLAKKHGQDDEAKTLAYEIELVSAYLPQKLSEEETKALIESIVAETGASSPRDMGVVMKALMQSGKAVDGKMAKGILGSILN
jgi:uncharacterized protein